MVGSCSPCSKDPITSVTEAFIADTSPTKINLGVGACRDDEGKPVILQCVREAGAKITGCDFMESVSSAVSSKLVAGSVKSVNGKNSDVRKEGRLAGIQALSGTGDCSLFAEFQKHWCPESPMYLPDPTCYHKIWKDALVPKRTYHYYHPDSKGLNFAALLDDVKIVHFSYSALALTTQLGFSTEEQWRGISYHFKLIMPELDAQSIRIFVEDGHLIGCVQSFVKNMGLYGHRVGCLKHVHVLDYISVLCNDAKQAVAIEIQLQQIGMAISQVTKLQVGMFCLSCLTTEQVDRLAFIEKQQKRNHGLLLNQLKLKEPSYCNWVLRAHVVIFAGHEKEQKENLQKELSMSQGYERNFPELCIPSDFALFMLIFWDYMSKI
ncbi:hypothetical protein POTOM_053074 [Populus tomentosa]|uniref:Aminotransferase class I/classII large domain-containing protein n=1 Tax=Populus tomentosa TaxID=118781 RepID=A0A8X8C9B0_POPTO|nr:hypothetical protein POTOM_053074 [Populus tomentosa]